MEIASKRLVDFIKRLKIVTEEVIDLHVAGELTREQQEEIRGILVSVDCALQLFPETNLELADITHLPLFTGSELAHTIKCHARCADALRTVMLSTEIPLHWNTIYQRVFALMDGNFSDSDNMPQHGHPGMTRWQYRLSWDMQQLRSEGAVKSVGDGYWMRTDSNAPRYQTELFD